MIPHPLLAKFGTDNHYCVFAVDATTLRMQAFRPDGSVLDSLTITKHAGRYDAAYLRRAQPMEAAIAAQDALHRLQH